VREGREVERVRRRDCQSEGAEAEVSSGFGTTEVEAEAEVEVSGRLGTRVTTKKVKLCRLECDVERMENMSGAEMPQCESLSDVSAKGGVQLVGNVLEKIQLVGGVLGRGCSNGMYNSRSWS
jgi:hypothetical protein